MYRKSLRFVRLRRNLYQPKATPQFLVGSLLRAQSPLQTAGGSGRRKLCVTDWDGDGRFDFLLNSANADLLQQTGEKDGVWIFKKLRHAREAEHRRPRREPRSR